MAQTGHEIDAAIGASFLYPVRLSAPMMSSTTPSAK